jgi:exopolyphosphatase/pppGpp-phosphohydrolase
MHSWRRLSATARAHRADVVEVVVTAPGRQPENGAELVEAIERTLQRRIRSLSADEEACLAFAGAVRSAVLSAPLLAASLILGEVQRRLVVPLRVSAGGVREGVLLAAAAEAAAA